MSIFCSKKIGNKGEQLVKEYLGEQGFFILDTNFTAQFGEIDIIAEKERRVYFIEVKTRTSISSGFPEEFLSYKQLTRIKRMTLLFLRLNPEFTSYEKTCCVASVLLVGNSHQIDLMYVE